MTLLLFSHFSHVQLFATLWTIAHQAPLSMGFSRQEYWSGLPCPPPPRDLPTQGSNLHLLHLLHCRQALYHSFIWLHQISAAAHGFFSVASGILVAAVGSSVAACEVLAAAHGI